MKMSEADKIIESLKNSGKKVEEFYVSNKTSDKNVGSIEDDINELKTLLFQDRLTNYGKRKMINYYENEITRQKQINEEHKRLNGELREKVKELEEKNKHLSNTSDYETISLECTNLEEQLEIANNRIQELEEENKKVKAQHVFTRNEATDEEKAELYDVIDKTLGTFLEQEKPIWQQEMTTDKMNLEEALNIVNEMYQDRYKIIQENDTIYVDKLKDVKFTNLEFASVILLREVQSLQNKFKNSIPTQKVIDKTEYLKKQRRELGFKTYLKREDIINDDRVIMCEISVLQELLQESEDK